MAYDSEAWRMKEGTIQSTFITGVCNHNLLLYQKHKTQKENRYFVNDPETIIDRC